MVEIDYSIDNGAVMNDYFKNALKNFTSDVAYGDEIRALARKGMTVRQIADKLIYPVDETIIREAVWKYYLQSGIVNFKKPDEKLENVKRVKYVLDRGECGRSSYRRVEEAVTDAPCEYVPCDFGKRLYNDKDIFMKSLEKLNKDDRDYILGLPWPIDIVFHIKNERIMRIMKQL